MFEFVVAKKSDIVLLKDVIGFCGFAGFPYVSKYKIILLIIFNFVAISYTFKEYVNSIDVLSYIMIFIFSSQKVFMIIFNLLSLKSTCRDEKLWKDFFWFVETFEVKMGMKGLVHEERVFIYFIRLVLGNVIYVTMFISFCFYLKKSDPEAIIVVAHMYFIMIQIFTSISILGNSLKILQKRYDYLRKEINEAYSFTQHRSFLNCQRLKIGYLLVADATGKINQIFGQRILIIIILTFVYVTGGLQFFVMVETTLRHRDIYGTFVSSVIIIIFLVSIIF